MISDAAKSVAARFLPASPSRRRSSVFSSSTRVCRARAALSPGAMRNPLSPSATISAMPAERPAADQPAGLPWQPQGAVVIAVVGLLEAQGFNAGRDGNDPFRRQPKLPALFRFTAATGGDAVGTPKQPSVQQAQLSRVRRRRK